MVESTIKNAQTENHQLVSATIKNTEYQGLLSKYCELSSDRYP